MSPYYFRVTDNNFVNNDTDFDIQYPGTFYFYRNYYGRVKKNVDDMTSAEILAALEKGLQEYTKPAADK